MKEQINRKYGIYSKIGVDGDICSSNLVQEQKYINELNLNLNRYELNKKMLIEKAEKLSQVEDELTSNNEILNELLNYQESLNIAKEALTEAYQEMRESITPKFTQNLSSAVSSITNGKYKTVKVDNENRLILESETRKIC